MRAVRFSVGNTNALRSSASQSGRNSDFSEHRQSRDANLEKHRNVILEIAADVTSALFLVSLVGGAQPGFFEFAYGLLDRHPGSAALRERLTNVAAAGDVGEMQGIDRHRAVVKRVDETLKGAKTLPAHVAWLSEVREKAKAGVAEDERIFGRDDEPFGWE